MPGNPGSTSLRCTLWFWRLSRSSSTAGKIRRRRSWAKAWQNDWGAPGLLRPAATHGHLERFSAPLGVKMHLEAHVLLDPGPLRPSLGASACLETAETPLELEHATHLLVPHRRNLCGKCRFCSMYNAYHEYIAILREFERFEQWIPADRIKCS